MKRKKLLKVLERILDNLEADADERANHVSLYLEISQSIETQLKCLHQLLDHKDLRQILVFWNEFKTFKTQVPDAHIGIVDGKMFNWIEDIATQIDLMSTPGIHTLTLEIQIPKVVEGESIANSYDIVGLRHTPPTPETHAETSETVTVPETLSPSTFSDDTVQQFVEEIIAEANV